MTATGWLWVFLMLLVLDPFVRAQGQTLPYDHVHLAAPDPAKAVEWYRLNLGGQPTDEGPDRLMFGSTRVIFLKAERALPSAGSAIDHIGFSVTDLDAKMKEFEAAGITIVAPVRDVAGLFKLGYIEDPWGVKIEVVQDPDTLGFHHVHVRGPDPEDVLKWCLDAFGGERAKLKGRIDAVKYGDVWVLGQKGDATPSAGHAIDHASWRAPNLDALAAELKAKGVQFTSDPRPANKLRIAYVEGPGGLKVELVQR